MKINVLVSAQQFFCVVTTRLSVLNFLPVFSTMAVLVMLSLIKQCYESLFTISFYEVLTGIEVTILECLRYVFRVPYNIRYF